MKKNVLYYLLSLILVCSIASCGKDGAEGPSGSKGEQGIQGERGIPGTDGKMIRYGTIEPAIGLGNEGDFYINTVASMLYGPKASAGWGTGTSLVGGKGDEGKKGDKGEDGARGSQFFSGDKNPIADIGSIGDFYFNTVSGSIFGPKNSDGWGSGTKLHGNVNVNDRLGWVVLDEINGSSGMWERDSHISGGSYGAEEPGDIGQPFVYNWWTGNFKSHTGVTLVYLDDNSAVRMLPFKKRVYKEEKGSIVMDAIIEFRFAMSPVSNGADWYLYPMIAVKEGTVNDVYLINTYVKTLKWRAVNIPANIISHKNIDFQDFQAVMEVLNLRN